MFGTCCRNRCNPCNLVDRTVRQIRNIQGNDDVGLVDLELQDGAPTENSQLTCGAPKPDELKACVRQPLGGIMAVTFLVSIGVGVWAGFKSAPSEGREGAVLTGLLAASFSGAGLIGVGYFALFLGVNIYTCCYHSCQNAAS